MRLYSIVKVAILFVGFLTVGYSQQQSLTAREEIIELEKSFAAAIKSQDTAQTKKFQADTYFLAIGVQGAPIQIVPREQWLSGLKDYVTESFSIDDIKVNVYGNTAVAMLLVSQRATVRGQDRSAQFVLTDTWVKGEQGWRIVARHSSRPEPSSAVRPK
ncbi:MAG TPA: nuclear transport factor 2 family protein [Bacteroidota bacterium]|nr:nuclear transport factor 2 family protein [Bacteroidota bacterium]